LWHSNKPYQALLDHFNRGVILAINSRNNPEDALAVIRTHPNMILKEPYFAAMRINWQDKAQNLKELAQELNIGLDSMVFFDDDPTNRALVRAILPQVEVPEMPADSSQYASFLNSLDYFPAEATTDEDKMRGNLYVTERLRKEEEKQYANKEDFLESLRLELDIREDDPSCLPRLSQLTEKTNQFNTDKKPFSEDEIRRYIDRPGRHVYWAHLRDKFGDHGVIALAFVEAKGKTWHISSMLMSCRVFDRGVEYALLSFIAQRARKAGAHDLTVSFAETEKNSPAKKFIESYFTSGRCSVGKAPSIPHWIKLKTK
jgi:FkbH-like protein